MSAEAVIDDLHNGLITDTHVDLSGVENSHVHNQLVFRQIELMKVINFYYYKGYLTATIVSEDGQNSWFKDIKLSDEYLRELEKEQKKHRKMLQPRILEQIPTKLVVGIVVAIAIWCLQALFQWVFPELYLQLLNDPINTMKSLLAQYG